MSSWHGLVFKWFVSKVRKALVQLSRLVYRTSHSTETMHREYYVLHSFIHTMKHNENIIIGKVRRAEAQITFRSGGGVGEIVP